MSVGEHDRRQAEWVDWAQQTLDRTLPYTETWRVNAEAVVALAAELAAVREERDRLRDALAWIKARADRGVADGHLMIVDAIEISNKARAALSVSVPDGQAACDQACKDEGKCSGYCAGDGDASGGPAETAAETAG